MAYSEEKYIRQAAQKLRAAADRIERYSGATERYERGQLTRNINQADWIIKCIKRRRGQKT